jgi:hypothetical protein
MHAHGYFRHCREVIARITLNAVGSELMSDGGGIRVQDIDIAAKFKVLFHSREL